MVFALNWFSGLGYGILEPSRESTSAQSKSRERKRKSLPHINFELCNLEIEKLKIRQADLSSRFQQTGSNSYYSRKHNSRKYLTVVVQYQFKGTNQHSNAGKWAFFNEKSFFDPEILKCLHNFLIFLLNKPGQVFNSHVGVLFDLQASRIRANYHEGISGRYLKFFGIRFQGKKPLFQIITQRFICPINWPTKPRKLAL